MRLVRLVGAVGGRFRRVVMFLGFLMAVLQPLADLLVLLPALLHPLGLALLVVLSLALRNPLGLTLNTTRLQLNSSEMIKRE